METVFERISGKMFTEKSKLLKAKCVQNRYFNIYMRFPNKEASQVDSLMTGYICIGNGTCHCVNTTSKPWNHQENTTTHSGRPGLPLFQMQAGQGDRFAQLCCNCLPCTRS